MPIDPRMVKWDDAPSSDTLPNKIDPKMVKWADEPKPDDTPSINPMSAMLNSGALGAIGMLATPEGRQRMVNGVSGMVRGAGSIGSTLMYPIDKITDMVKGDREQKLSDLVTGNKPISRNEERRASIDEGLQNLVGADPNSWEYKGGKLTGEIAGTAGAGGAIAKVLGWGAPALIANSPRLTQLVNAIGSSGMTTGAKVASTFGGKAADLGVRTVGSGITGLVSGAAIDPNEAVNAGMISAALPSVLKAGGALGKYGANVLGSVIRPFTENGQKQLAGNIINKFAEGGNKNIDASQIIQGSYPTLAESTGNAGIARLQSGARDLRPNAFVERERANALARSAAFDDIAGDVGKLDFFKSARSDAAGDLYSQALGATPEPLTPYLKGQITQLMKRPSIHDARRAAQDLAIERGEKPLSEGSLPALHDMKTMMDDKIAAAVQQNQGGQVKALQATKAKLVDVMEKLSPQYGEARATYAAMSQPVNEMEALQGLKLHDQVGNITLSKIQNAISGIENMRNASGINNAKSIATDKLATLNKIRNDLLRQNNLLAGKSAGSNTFQNIATDNILSNMLPGKLGAAINGKIGTGVGQVGKLLYSGSNDKIKGLLADSMLDPELAKILMNPQIKNSKLKGLLSSGLEDSLPFAYRLAPPISADL